MEIETTDDMIEVKQLYQDIEKNFNELMKIDSISRVYLNDMQRNCENLFESSESELVELLAKKAIKSLPVLDARQERAEAYISYAQMIQDLYQ